MSVRHSAFLACAALLASNCAVGAEAASVDKQTLVYASIDGHDLVLDLFRPTGNGATLPAKLPIIVFLHGGGWQRGTRATGPDFKRFFAQDGFAIASIDYRLTPAITFPANVVDVRTAVRWLRANAEKLGLDAQRICLWGTSAGGHLAAIAALAPRGTFEGPDNANVSSEVQCVLDAYGPVAFELMDKQTDLERPALQAIPESLRSPAAEGGAAPANIAHDDANSPESRLVGAPIQTVPDKVKAASPLTYVTNRAPPFLIMHGLADGSVPHGQSLLLYTALAKAGNSATLRLIDGLPHTFFNRSDLDEVAGPHAMQVRESGRGREKRYAERAGVFEVARNFFTAHLK